MRPVQISPTAINAAGDPILINRYQDAKPHLQHQIGIYCVFCERKIVTSLAVEHKQPKDLAAYAARERDWTNFVLGCANCNSTKGVTDTGTLQCFFPDEVNTAYAFVYEQTNSVRPHPDLTPDEQVIAGRTLSMVGLNRRELMPNTRWTQRGQAWEKAKRYRAKVASADTPESWDDVICLAEETGFWSVWMTVFDDHVEVRRRLIDAFTGTRSRCFDANGFVIPDLSL